MCKKHGQWCGLQYATRQKKVVLADHGQCCSALRCDVSLGHKLGPGKCDNGNIGSINNRTVKNQFNTILHHIVFFFKLTFYHGICSNNIRL